MAQQQEGMSTGVHFLLSDRRMDARWNGRQNNQHLPHQHASATNLALTLPGLTAVQVPLGASTIITSSGLRSTYEITQQWFANCQLSYSRIEFIDSPRLDNSWVFDATLRYDIWRNMSLTWEYRYTTILSNAPLASATSNYGIMSATYKF